jgi:hypothetical protein
MLNYAKEVFYYIWRCDIQLELKLITLMWVLTTERNAVNVGERMKSSGQVVSVPCRSGIPVYQLQVETMGRVCVHAPPHVPQLWTPPPY